MSGIGGRKNLTSKEAARLLGASEASVKRWADGGLLPTLKTAGGHRRFRPEDVAAFRRGRGARGLRECFPQERRSLTRLPASHDAGRRHARRSRCQASMFETLLGRTRRGRRGRHSSVSTCKGTRWRASRTPYSARHCAGSATSGTRASFRSRRSTGDAHGALGRADPAATRWTLQGRGRAAICCSVEDDFHELPVSLASLTLEASRVGRRQPRHEHALLRARRGGRALSARAWSASPRPSSTTRTGRRASTASSAPRRDASGRR